MTFGALVQSRADEVQEWLQHARSHNIMILSSLIGDEGIDEGVGYWR